MANTLHTTPSKAECWAEFREVMSTVVADLARAGRFDEQQQPVLAEAA